MRKKIAIAFCCLFSGLLSGCDTGVAQEEIIVVEPVISTKEKLFSLAFGSCNSQKKKQDHWRTLSRYYEQNRKGEFPDIWLWAGDAVYGDTKHPEEMQEAYDMLLNSPYSEFVDKCQSSDCQIVGTWDDHDFGHDNLVGDIGKVSSTKLLLFNFIETFGIDVARNSPFKDFSREQRKAVFVDFLGEPTRSQVAKRNQIYTDYRFERNGISILLTLLDLRYDRQPPGPDARIMDENQWRWLEERLSDDTVDLHLIASGSQVLRENPVKETWGHYPVYRDRLLKLIGDNNKQKVVFLTGDIHGAEFSRLGKEKEAIYGIDYPLYEITASGLNQDKCDGSDCGGYDWSNKYREGFAFRENFGEIDVARTDKGELLVTATLRSTYRPELEVLLRKNIVFADKRI